MTGDGGISPGYHLHPYTATDHGQGQALTQDDQGMVLAGAGEKRVNGGGELGIMLEQETPCAESG